MFSVIQSIRDMAKSSRFAPAIINGSRILTHGELLDFIARVSNHLIDRGIPPRSRLVVDIADPDQKLVASLACLHAGFVPYVTTAILGLRAGIDYDFVIGAPRTEVPSLPPDIVIDESVLAGRLVDPVLREFPDRGDRDIFFFATSSGTTGVPKIVAERYRPFIRKILDPRPYDIDEGERVLATIGDASKWGFGGQLRTLLKKGAIVRYNRDLPRLLSDINLYSVTRLVTTPASLSSLLRSIEETGVKAPSLRRLTVGGSLIHKTLADRTVDILGAELIFNYGSSEVGGISSGKYDPKTFRNGYVGEICPDVVVFGSGTASAPAELVLVDHDKVFCEYYVDGKIVPLTGEFYTMPDVGYLEGSSLYLIGRSDEVFNVGGDKFPFAVIEEPLRRRAEIADLGLVNTPPDWEREGLIIGVAASGLDLAALSKEICDQVGLGHARANLFFVQLSAIPRNVTGKVDRSALIEAYLNSRPTTG